MLSKEDMKKQREMIRRAGVKAVSLAIRGEESSLKGYVERWWAGEDLGLEDKRDFYHGRLRVKNLEADRLSLEAKAFSSAYVFYHGKAVSGK